MREPDGVAFRHNELLRGIPAGVIERAELRPELVTVEAGEGIFEEGAVGDFCYLVESGAVDLSKRSEAGAQEILDRVGPGGFFGEMALYDDAPRAARATAAERSRLAKLDRASLLRLREVAPLEVMSILFDVSARRVRQMNERLAAGGQGGWTQEKIGTYAHNLRSPLATLIDASDTLLELVRMGADPEKLTRFAGMIRRSGLKALADADHHVAVLRGERTSERAKVPVGEIVDEVRQRTAAVVRRAGVDFDAGSDSERTVYAERAEVVAALDNLVRNAVEALPPEGGTVRLRATDEDGWAVFAVSDTGSGIPADVLPRIFERRFTSGKAGGTGIGLAHAKDIAVRHGGKIEVDTEVGRGTTFRFILPF